jgi:hypothetical protein
MKKMLGLILFGALCISAAQAFAQEKSPEKAKSEERKPGIPVKVQVVLTEYDGDKKIANMPYSFVVISDEKMGGYYSTSLRTGVRIPIQTEGKDQKTTYFDIGSNIDCGVRSEEDGRFHIYMIFERSALYPSAPAGDEKLEVSRPNNLPLIRQFKTSENLILKDGQTSESILSTDPLSGHVMRIAVSINTIK